MINKELHQKARRFEPAFKSFGPFVIGILLFMCTGLRLFAADESYVQTLSGKIKKGDSCVVIDDKFDKLPLADWNLLKNLTVDNIISFELRRDTSVFFYNKSFTCTANVTIKYFSSRDQQTPQEIKDINIVVKYDTASGSFYPVDASYRFKNGYKVTVVVNSITSKEFGKKIPDIFRIRNQILVKRKYPFNPHETGKLQLHVQEQAAPSPAKGAAMLRMATTLDQTDKKIDITWDPADFSNPEEYDLEWTYIDKLGEQGLQIMNSYGGSTGPYTIPESLIEEWMRFDGTRVTVSSPLYSINLPYSDGFIVVRIRKADYEVSTDLRLTSPWVYTDDNDHAACIFIQAHNEFLNWQYTGSFAEEGKRKEVVNYFDATMRSRQLVTLSNTENKAIVAETIYDRMGRATMNILPAPLDDDKLQYYPAVNKNASGAAYSNDDIEFPENTNNVSPCNIAAHVLSNLSGASQYYSANNPFISNLSYYFTKYVPDAEEYPFSVTEYTPDNTGRIRRQGGVGEKLRIGGKYDTKYYYGKPAQKDLDRLFGVEAGNASHYLKNMVVDPNGQVSVSYIDPSGKTVATALAGIPPGNINELTSSTAPEAKVRLNQTLIGAADFKADAAVLSKKATATFLAAGEGNYKVHYSISPAALKTAPSGSDEFCSNCYYSITVDIKNECGEVVKSKNSTPFTGNDITCSPNPVIVTDFVDFTVGVRGEYTVTYRLTLSEEQIKYQVDQYVANNTDLKTLQGFLHDEVLNADLAACYSECSTCEVKLGTLSAFTEKMSALLLKLKNDKYEGLTFDPASATITNWISSTYNLLYANCTAMAANCNPVSPCDQKLEQMKADVRPGGQYALYDPESFAIPASETNLSILSYNKGVALNYKSDPQITNFQFTDESGQVRNIKDANVTLAEFFKAYLQHPEWADDFVKRHIEYCSYLWCRDYASSSYIFDAKLREQFTTGEKAVAAGYFNRGNYKALLDANKDPFFAAGGPGAAYKLKMIDDLFRMSDVLKMTPKNQSGVLQTTKSITQVVDWMLYCKPLSATATVNDLINSWNNSCAPGLNCRSTSREWELYRNYYLMIKAKYVELAKREALPSCRNCFVGEENISPGGCSPNEVPPACPTFQQFTNVTDGYTQIIQYNYYWKTNQKYFQYNFGSVPRDVNLRIRRYAYNYRTSTHSDTYEVKTLFAGQSKFHLGTETTEWVDQNSDGIVQDPWELSIVQYHVTEVTCGPSTVPLNSTCQFDPLYSLYRVKQKVFNEYINNQGYSDCLESSKPFGGDNVASVTALRSKALSDLNYLKDSWESKLKSVRDEQNDDDYENGVAKRFESITNLQITTLIGHLYEVAKKHIETADVYNVRAASSLPTGIFSANGHNNFAEAFEAIIGSTLMEKGFGPDLLEQPYPYNKTPFSANISVGDIANTSICSTLVALRPSGYTDQQFHAWLQQELKDDYKLSLAELQDLVSRCTNNCRVLDKPLLLPVAFMTTESGAEPHPYKDCNFVSGLLTDFESIYPEVTEGTKLFRVLFTNYLNKRLGYALSYDEYAVFLNTSCVANPNARLYNKPASPLLLPDDFSCTADIIASAFDRAGQEYERYITEIKRNFRNAYISKCLKSKASANLEGETYEYHYTLYFYDQSGNLVKTISPEGVAILQGAEMDKMNTYRDIDNACAALGLPQEDNRQATFTTLSTAMQNNTAKSIEMWLFGNGGNTRQFRIVTPDDKYMWQAALENGKLWVELYRLNKVSNQQIDITASFHVVADVSAIVLKDWSHLVIQSAAGIAGGTFNIYLDGQLLTQLAPGVAPAYPLEWSINAVTGNYVMPAVDVAAFRQMRIYNRQMTVPEIAANMQSVCFSPEGNLASNGNPLLAWGRFNMPTPGSEYTAGPSSTTEYQMPFLVPQHRMPTNYYHNSLNQVVKQSSPDGGTSEFWYDRLGRLAISQNEEQKSPVLVNPENPANRFSYTKYDALGRIKEVGEKLSAGTVTEINARTDSWLTGWLASGTNRQVTVTHYDNQPSWLPASLNGALSNLRKRVVVTALLSTGSDPASNRQAASYYSYDISGNVKTLTQENAALASREAAYVTGSTGLKQLKYEYDLVSGKVNKVLYQDGKWDQFYYQYLYDADNRIVSALSSRNNESNPDLWVKEATYHYYLHGPLARMELGKNKVQGMDYAYTLQGWLKGVNGQFLDADKDMSGDGKSGTAFANHARDALAFSLGYYMNDYKPINGHTNSPAFALQYTAPAFDPTGTVRSYDSGRELFNGNISNSTYAISKINFGATAGKSYAYDQLNRLIWAKFHHPIGSSGTWDNSTIAPSIYDEFFEYDANGNILNLFRTAYDKPGVGSYMDFMMYHYERDVNGKLLHNRLNSIEDPMPDNNFDGEFNGQALNNYSYDKIGNMVGDVSESISRINWTVYGKIASITKAGNTMSYRYDASGSRITKTVSATKEDYYVRDAQGNVMATYAYNSNTFSWVEQHLYGSSRVGLARPNLTIQNTTPLANVNYNNTGDPITNGTEGKRAYELSNHLGNVMVTISDRKIGVDVGGNNSIDYYEPEILTAQDYYAFGMLMPERTYSNGGAKYRYGFNGKENDNEVKGEGNQQDYGMRIYDSRIAKFLSVDPITAQYPELTPYQFASNSPISGIDLDGLEYITAIYNVTIKNGQNVVTSEYVWTNALTHSEKGLKGGGVNYQIHINNLDNFTTTNNYYFMPRGENSDLSKLTQYGNYMGSAPLLNFDAYTGTPLPNTYRYDVPSVDYVDEQARLHDLGYDRVGAVGASGLMTDFATTPYDEDALNAWRNYLDNYPAGTSKDPVNNEPVRKQARDAAWRGAKLFSGVVANKKEAISHFMMRNYPKEAKSRYSFSTKEQTAADEDNYQLFLNKYMIKNGGNWERAKGKWKDNKPKTKKELDEN